MTRVAVVGAGLMGSGIAQVAAQAGYDVVLHDTTSQALERAMTAIAASQVRLVARSVLTEADAEAARARIVTTTDLDDIASAQIVVEAVFEQLEIKLEVFPRDRRARRTGCGARDEHDRDSDHQDRGRDIATRGRRRHPLLLTGSGDAAV